jgi:hypothetical protein
MHFNKNISNQKKSNMLIKKVLKLDTLQYYNTHLQIINPLLPKHLTLKEIEFLANFMSFDGTIANDRFGTTARKIVKTQMKISNAGVSNYMRSLKDKGFVKDDIILPLLFPDPNHQEYDFTLINYEN